MRWNRNAALIILYVPHCTVKIPTIANSTHPIATGEEFLGLAGVKNQQWKGQHECCVILCQVYLKKVRTKVGGSPERYCIPRSNCSHSPFNNAAMECWVQTAMEYWICHLPLSTFWRWEGVLRTRRNMRITCWSILCLFCALFCLYPKRGNAFVLGNGTFFDWIESVGIIYCAFDIYGYGHELTFLILHLDTYITQGGAAWGILRLVLWVRLELPE